MKYLFLLLLLCSFTYTTEPKHEGKSNIDVLSAKTQQVFGKNIGYSMLSLKTILIKKLMD